MLNRSDRPRPGADSSQAQSSKRLGGYLIEAGLLTPGQVDVALNDQKLTGMRFGEILSTRGWVKQQTIEYLMTKVVLPERQQLQQKHSQPAVAKQSQLQERKPALEARQDHAGRHDIITKPLPSVKSSGEDVNWVG